MTPLTLHEAAESLTVCRDGSEPAVLVQNAPAGGRPFIHPLMVPGSAASVTEDAPHHHPWQHGLYIGLNDVNGVGFWTEGIDVAGRATDGTFRSRLQSAHAAGDEAAWTVATDYLDPAGGALLSDSQSWRLGDLGDRFELTLDWTLEAAVDVTFGRFDYGGLFLRTPYRVEVGGTVFSSEAPEGPAADAVGAAWVAIRMAFPGHAGDAVVAILDHPSNLRHPVPWRIDDDLGVGPSPSISGPWHLDSGAHRRFRYRVLVFDAPVDAPAVERLWQVFAGEADT